MLGLLLTPLEDEDFLDFPLSMVVIASDVVLVVLPCLGLSILMMSS